MCYIHSVFTSISDTQRPTLNRPLVLVAFSFWLGVLAVALGWVSSYTLILLFAVFSLIGWRMVPDRFRYAHYPIALLFFITGAFIWSIHHADSSGDRVQQIVLDHPENTRYTLSGRVERGDIFLPGDAYTQCYLRVDTLVVDDQHYSVSGGVLIRWSKPDAPLLHSERITVTGKVLPTLHRVNHGVRGVETHHRLQNVHSSMRLSGADSVVRHQKYHEWSLGYWASRLRQDLAEKLIRVVPESAQDFVLTVWLGDRRRVAGNTYTSFLESGTAHILAVSGVHIGLIYMTVSYLLRLLIRSPRKRIILTLLAVALFAFMAGARISSLRAAIMIGLYLMAEWVDREPDAPTALSLAALIFGIQNPNVIFMPGFQLSFLSIASILLFRPFMTGLLTRFPYWFQEGVGTTLSVQILPLPAAILAFNIVPIAGILLNILVIPLLSIVLWLAFLTSLCLYLIPSIAPWFANALLPFVALIEGLAEYVSSFRLSHLYLSSPSTLSICAYVLVLFGVWWWMHYPKRFHKPLGLIVLSLLVCTLCWTPRSHQANVTFLDVGQGDSAVVHTEDNKVILIDGGNASEYADMGKQVVAPYLWAQHINRVDAIFVSHVDSDHLGGLVYVLRHFPVSMVYTAPHFSESHEGRQFLEVCEETETPVNTLVQGDTLKVGEATIQIIHPAAETMGSLGDNDRSLVFTLESAGISTLFTGDIEESAESMIFQAHKIDVDLIKVPHHASDTSSTPIFFEAVHAQHAIVSSGLRSGKPFARTRVLEQYRAENIAVHRSDYLGSVRVMRQKGRLIVTYARKQGGIAIRTESSKK